MVAVALATQVHIFCNLKAAEPLIRSARAYWIIVHEGNPRSRPALCPGPQAADISEQYKDHRLRKSLSVVLSTILQQDIQQKQSQEYPEVVQGARNKIVQSYIKSISSLQYATIIKFYQNSIGKFPTFTSRYRSRQSNGQPYFRHRQRHAQRYFGQAHRSNLVNDIRRFPENYRNQNSSDSFSYASI